MCRTVYSKFLPSLILLCFAAGNASAQEWNPKPNWKDSYAVDGQCYCDSNGYDHNLDSKSADTPIGKLNVVQICEDIKAELGSGSSNGRIPYNDIQCGHGPANDAADETGCPGRVDIGSAGCDVKGPTWNLEKVYGDGGSTPTPTPTPTPTSNGASASENGGDAGFALDNNSNTRWTTRTDQSPGQVFQLDLGGTQTIGKVILDSRGSPGDEPAGYSLSVSTNGSNYSVEATGSGSSNGLTEINFDNQSVRYVRVTQTGSKNGKWWSIHDVMVGENSGGSGGNDNGGDELDSSSWVMYASSNNNSTGNATDGSSSSRWDTGEPQRDDQWFEIDMGRSESFNKIVLDTQGSSNDYPREYRVSVSDNGSDWDSVASGSGNNSVTTVTFDMQSAQFIRIEQLDTIDRWYWSIHELGVYK